MILALFACPEYYQSTGSADTLANAAAREKKHGAAATGPTRRSTSKAAKSQPVRCANA
jgi:hypothetical protein